MKKSIYERMASSTLLSTEHSSQGEFPKVTHFVTFTYANGLVTSHDGVKWYVIEEEFAESV